ncbi:MFS transporter [Catenulispora subtropica]|uniref:MFS transporter n=1 Tax=Catenulispora subtropica TaxID=450798 RepID=A0ABP5DBC9_9ACTN
MISRGGAVRAGLRAWWARVSPEPGPQRALVASSFVNRLGTGMFVAVSALYFTLIVGIPARQVGTGLTIAGTAGLLGSVPAGMLADRVGPRMVQLVTLGVQTGTMAAFVFVHSWWMFTTVTALDKVADAANNAARGALIGRVGGERPALFRAKLRSFVSVAVVLGTPVAGIAIQIGTRAAYVTLILANAASYVVCALLLLRVPEYPPIPRPAGSRRFAALADRPYAAFAGLNGLLSLQAVVVALVIPLWITTRTQVPRTMAAVVFGMFFVVGVLLMQPVGRRTETVAQGGRALRTSGLAVAAGCAVLAVSAEGPRWAQAAVLLFGAAIICAASVWALAAGFSLSFGLSPAHAQGEYQGLNLLGLDAAAAVGPALLTALVLGFGGPGWFVLGAGFAAAGLLGPPVTRWAQRTRPDTADAGAVADAAPSLSARAARPSAAGSSAP